MKTIFYPLPLCHPLVWCWPGKEIQYISCSKWSHYTLIPAKVQVLITTFEESHAKDNHRLLTKPFPHTHIWKFLRVACSTSWGCIQHLLHCRDACSSNKGAVGRLCTASLGWLHGASLSGMHTASLWCSKLPQELYTILWGLHAAHLGRLNRHYTTHIYLLHLHYIQTYKQ